MPTFALPDGQSGLPTQRDVLVDAGFERIERIEVSASETHRLDDVVAYLRTTGSRRPARSAQTDALRAGCPRATQCGSRRRVP